MRGKVLQAAANMLEATSTMSSSRDGAVCVKGTDRKVPLAAIATATNPLRYAFNEAAKAATQFAPASRHDGPPLAEGQHPGLEATDYYSPACATWAYGVHGAIIEVDPETLRGQGPKIRLHPRLRQHDQPELVEGQVLGGIAQGFGGALYERIEYDADGKLTNATFMDFLVPYATEVPHVEVLHLETPSPLNPLGVKGVGEAGASRSARWSRRASRMRCARSALPSHPGAAQSEQHPPPDRAGVACTASPSTPAGHSPMWSRSRRDGRSPSRSRRRRRRATRRRASRRRAQGGGARSASSPRNLACSLHGSTVATNAVLEHKFAGSGCSSRAASAT